MSKLLKKELCIVFALALIFSISVLYYTGMHKGGYILGDHQMYLTIKHSLQEQTILSTLIDFVKNELQYRYRPIYYVQYVLEVALFENNFAAIHLLRGVEWAFLFMLLYWIAREFGCNALYACSFPLIILIGDQVQILYDLCTVNLVSMIILALNILFMIKYVKDKTRFWQIGFYFSFMLELISLEEYVILVPFLLLMFVFLMMKYHGLTLKEAILQNIKMILCVVILFAAVAIYICLNFKMHDNVLGAGLGGSIKEICLNSFASVYQLGYPINIILFEAMLFLGERACKLKYHFIDIIFVSGIISGGVAIELLIHSKGVMGLRYKLPFMVCVGFLACIIFYNEFRKDRYKIIINFLLFTVLISTHMFRLLGGLIWYSEYCDNTKKCIDYIMANTEKDGIIWCGYNIGLENNINVGMQMMLEELGYGGGYIFHPGQLVDAYNVENGDLITNDIMESFDIATSPYWLYNFFNYHPKYYVTASYEDVDTIFIETGTEKEILDMVGDENYLKQYSGEIFSNFTIYIKNR